MSDITEDEYNALILLTGPYLRHLGIQLGAELGADKAADIVDMVGMCFAQIAEETYKLGRDKGWALVRGEHETIH